MFDRLHYFQQWRGDKAQAELVYLQTADLISDYVHSVDTLEQIQNDLQHASLPKFIEFDQYEGRTRGASLLFKLIMEEALNYLSADAAGSPLCNILTQLNSISTSAYIEKRLSSSTLDELLNHLKQLLQLEDDAFAPLGEAQTKKLFFTLYALLHIAFSILNDLGSYYWLVALVVDVKQTITSITEILEQVRAKMQNFHPQRQEAEPHESSVRLQAHLNQYYLNLLDRESEPVNREESNIIEKINLLHREMERISTHISHLIELKKRKAELALNIQQITSLLQAAKTNDQQVSYRKYFGELIKENQQTFHVLMNSTNGEQKDLLIARMEQLAQAIETQELPVRMTYFLSQIASPLIQAYRRLTPQLAQDVMMAYMPDTLDSECKRMLQELAGNYLAAAGDELMEKQEEIDRIADQLFEEDDLKLLIVTETVTTLNVMYQNNMQVQDTIRMYCGLLQLVKGNMDFLHKCQADTHTLEQFLKLNNNFWVTLSNFFARFCVLFKTDMARLVDEIIDCKKSIELLAVEYQTAISQQLQQVDADPHLNQPLKTQIGSYFLTHVNETYTVQPDSASIKKSDIQLLVLNLSRLLANAPKPQMTLPEEQSQSPVFM